MKHTPFSRILSATVFALLIPGAGGAADWNQWRGPNRDGIVTGFQVPSTWTAGSLARRWSVTVGEGHSSPIVVGERVYMFAREGDEEIMRCLSLADGKAIWRDAYAAPYELNRAARGHGKGPKSTPVVAAGRLFSLGIDGHLSAYDAAKGTVLWRKHFAKEYKSTSPVFGTSTSPIVDGNNVIVHVGGDDSGALTAFDAASGNVTWKWDGDGPAYTSPVIATLGGVRQLITQTQNHCLAVSPADGRLLWKIPFTTPHDQNTITPIVVGGLVIFGGIQKPMFAVKVTGTDAEQVWETNETTVYMSTPVANGTTLYGMSTKQRGSLFAMNALTGEVLWKGEGRLGENASITDVGSTLLVVTDGGELIVQQKSDGGLKELMRYKVADSPVWASPAISGNQILIKDKTGLTLFKVGGG